MRRLIALASAAAITLATVPMAGAQARPGNDCRPDQVCSQPERGGPGKKAEAPSKSRGHTRAEHATPRKGDSGRAGQPFQRAGNSRFQTPPRGQEYRVVNDHLVLVDQNTLAIVTVVGLLSNLLK